MNRRMRRNLVLGGCLLAGAGMTACGGDDSKPKAEAKCSGEAEAAVETAARKHVKTIVIGSKQVEGDAGKVTVDACSTGDDAAAATVTVSGLRDDSVRDQRHKLTLERKDDRWVITRDLDTLRCQEKRGHQDFSTLPCV